LTIAPGTQIGQYHIVSLLGEGGMGAVYYAEHVVLGRGAAIKTLLPHIARHPMLVQRFVNEARIAAAMNHRNVVDVLDCGQFPSPTAPNAQWYIVLEFLRGMSLGKFIAQHHGKPIELATILHILGEAANGLQAAHERHSLVHRDIKPDNLFLIETEDDPMRVKILDFGIAKLRQPGSGVHTHSQTAMGTPAYAAPEQLRESKHVDGRADVWALGVIAHEMATGLRPWGPTTSVYEIIAQHTALRQAPDPRAQRPDLPAKWAEAVSRAMEPDPGRRWRTPREFARALAEATPTPFSGNGMAILHKYANELTKGSTHSLTVGRPIPAEVAVDRAEIATARERPVASPQPGTISDGIPRLPGTPLAAAPGTAVLSEPIAQPTPTTIGGSAGQSISAAPAGPRPARRVVAVTAAAVTIVGAVVAVVLVATHSSQRREPESTPMQSPLAPDAGGTAVATAAVPDAALAMSSLAIITEPPGAEIFVDGVAKGAAPVDVSLPVGAEVVVRGVLDGYSPANEAVRIGNAPATVRLVLPALPSVAPPDALPPVAPPKSGKGKRRKQPRNDSEDGFDPNDVL
jgi:serine/threonine protein kinase